MNAYKLDAVLGHSFSVTCRFVAKDDAHARNLVAAWATVMQPMYHGPLWLIGTPNAEEGGWTIMDEENAKVVPLEVKQLELPDESAASS